MCWCRPEVRTPNCGSINCYPTKKDRPKPIPPPPKSCKCHECRTGQKLSGYQPCIKSLPKPSGPINNKFKGNADIGSVKANYLYIASIALSIGCGVGWYLS